MLTDDGEGALGRFRDRARADGQHAELVRVIEAADVEQLVDLLFVRRALEPEAARLAALRATDAEIVLTRAVADRHLHGVSAGADGGETAIQFHRLVAEASHNSMLTAVMNMLLNPAYASLQHLLVMISLDEGTTVAFGHEHGEIVQAIQTDDAVAAELAMRKHIDELIAVVGGYRTRHGRPVAPARVAGATGAN